MKLFKFGQLDTNFLKYPVEHRFLVMIPWFASLLTGISAIEGLFLNDPFFVVFCSLSTLVFAVVWHMVKSMIHLRLIAWIMVVNTLILINIVWFRFEGTRGTSPVIILMLLVCIAVFFKKAEKIAAIAIVLLNLIVLVYLENAFPHLIRNYGSEWVRMVDLFITYAVCGIFIVFVIHGILQSYTLEKTKSGQVDKLKTEFLLNISHEIRTPMNAIIGFSNLITQTKISTKDRLVYSKFVSDACKNLLNLVEEIIEVAQIESNQCNIQRETCNITDLIRDIYLFFYYAPEKQIEENVDFYLNKVCIETDVIIETDPSLIKRVLRNLVDNAIKFTHRGFIELGFTVRNSDILFYVKDSGIGLSKEDCSHVFNSFVKGEPKNGRLYKGIGLGLTLAKKIMELLKGEIWVSSEPDKGSTFYFTVPYSHIEVSYPV